MKFTSNTFGLAKKTYLSQPTVTVNQAIVKPELHTIDKNFIAFAFARADKVDALFMPPTSSLQV